MKRFQAHWLKCMTAASAALGVLMVSTASQAAILTTADFEVVVEIKDSSNAGIDTVRGVLGDGQVETELIETPPNHPFPKAGASGLASETGRTKVFAGSGAQVGEYAAVAFWEGTYTKTSTNDIFKFTITPGTLLLGDGGAVGGVLRANWELSIKLDGVSKFQSAAQIGGRGGTAADHTFRLEGEQGTRLNGAMFSTPVIVVPDVGAFVQEASYNTASHTDFIDLSAINVGDPFTIEYIVATFSKGLGGETIAYGHIGDPFSVGGGFSGEVVEIPEPAAGLLLVLGVMACGRRRRVALRRSSCH